jgi:ATP-binding cassette subfamily B protein
VVDDDEDARETLKMLLEMHRATVEALASGGELVDTLRARPRGRWPDLLVCDIGLHDVDGYTALRQVREQEAGRETPLESRMPAIALTGYAESEDRMRALLAGFQMHLAKPVDPAELLAAIGSLLHASRDHDRDVGAVH